MHKLKGILSIFFLLIIILVLLFLKVSIINALSFLDSSISAELIKNYYSHNLTLKKSSEREIINRVLKTIKYNNWLEYIEYIEINLYFSNIIPNGEDELIIALNLSKDSSVISVFTRKDDIYQFHSLIDNLMPIKKIEFYNIPDEDYNLMVIFQILDERLGAFIYEEYFDIYIYKSKDFEKLLKETVYYEEIFNKKWLDDSLSSDIWIKNMTSNNVTFISNSQLLINIIGTNKTYTADVIESTIPSKEDFILKNTSDYRYTYYWNKEFQNFSLFRESISYEGLEAIIQSSKSIDSKLYKIITNSGKVLYVNRNFILKH